MYVVQIRIPINLKDKSSEFEDFPEVFGVFDSEEIADEWIEQQELQGRYPLSTEYQISKITKQK